MVDIRPHRRLAVPFDPPAFKDLLDISDFVSPNYGHFGVVKVMESTLSQVGVPTLRRMCAGVGLRLFVECEDPKVAARCASEGADFVSVGYRDARSVSSGPLVLARVLSAVGTDMDLEYAKASPSDGVLCHASLVSAARRGLPGGSTVFCSGGDVIAAVRDGADFAVAPDCSYLDPDPASCLRALAEKFREFT